MPSTATISQNEITYADSPLATEGSRGMEKTTNAENRHLLRQGSGSKQPTQPLAMGNPRLCQSHESINSALLCDIKPPASYSSAPLQEELTTYCKDKNKSDRLIHNLTKPRMRDYLSQNESGVFFKQYPRTKQEFDTLIKALADENHGSNSSLTRRLKKAWRLTQEKSEAQQTSHPSKHLQEALRTYCENEEKASCLKQELTKPKLTDFLSLGKSGPFFKESQLTKQGFDTFIKVLENEGYSSKSTLIQRLKTAWDKSSQTAPTPQDTAQSVSAPSDKVPYPNKYNPFADAEADSVEQIQTSNVSATLPQATSSANTLSAPNKNEHHADDNNPFTDADDITSHEGLNPFAEDNDVSHTSSTSPQVETSKAPLPIIVLQSLNNYLRTLDGNNFGDINQAHVKKIEQDIANNKTISQYLRLNNNKVEWVDEKIVFTNDALKLFLNAIKAEHKKGGSMHQVLSLAFKMLNEADKAAEPQKGNEALQAARDSALYSPGSVTPSDTTPASSNEKRRTDSTPNKSAGSYLDGNNPFANAEANSVEQIKTSNSSVTSPQATSAEEENLEGLLQIVVESLNKYLQKEKKRAVVGIGLTHVEKIQKDFDNNLIIRQLLMWENGRLKWTGNNLTKENLQSLLNAFKTGHDRGASSLFKFLSDPRLRAAGLEILSEADYKKVIQLASKPALHSFGHEDVSEMKKETLTKVLEFVSSPENRNKPLPAGTLNRLIEHYIRIKPDLQKLQNFRDKKESQLSLNNTNSVFSVKTKEHTKNFSKTVATLGNDLLTETLSILRKAKKDHPPEAVNARVEEMLTHSLGVANDEAEKMGDYNVFPDSLNNELTKQIYEQVNRDTQAANKQIIAYTEEVFFDVLIAVALNFSASDYFDGKSRKRTATNIIVINATLASMYELAQEFHKNNIKETSNYVGPDSQKALSQEFEKRLSSLADSIKIKMLSNYQYVCTRYKQELDKIETPRSDKFTQCLTSSAALYALAKELHNDLSKILSADNTNAGLKLPSKDVAQAIGEVIEPVSVSFIEHLPKVESRWQTFKIALIKAFKPTPGRILGCIPLVGGLTIALTTLPKVIAIPLGITAGVVLPFALLGWVGWNIYKHFDQRSQIKHENTKTLKPLDDIRSLITTAAGAKD